MRDWTDAPSMPRFTAPIAAADGAPGVWHAEYCGIWSTREFILWSDGRVAVAPYDFAFRQQWRDPIQPPPLPDVAPIAFPAFEALWEETAQPRLQELALTHTTLLQDDAGIHYFYSPFPAELKVNEGASHIYREFAGGLGRREIEVWADMATVSPYESGVPEFKVEILLREAREHCTWEGEPLEPEFCSREISHLEFETQWIAHGLPRLRALAMRRSG